MDDFTRNGKVKNNIHLCAFSPKTYSDVTRFSFNYLVTLVSNESKIRENHSFPVKSKSRMAKANRSKGGKC